MDRKRTAKSAEQALEPDSIEAPGILTGDRGSLALMVYSPEPGQAGGLTIRSNIDDLVVKIQRMLDAVGDWDVDDADSYRQAKHTRSDIRAAKALIEGERKRIKNLYEKPLRDFERAVKRATGPLDEADKRFKEKLEAYEANMQRARRSALAAHYAELAPDLAEIIPFERFLELRGERGARGDLVWLRRTTDDYAAQQALEAALKAILADWTAIDAQATTPEDADRLRSYYAQTLDLGEAIRQLTADQEREGQIRAQREAEARWREEMERHSSIAPAPAPEPEPEPAPTPLPEPEPVYSWHITLDAHIKATRAQAREIASTFSKIGLRGGRIAREAEK